MPVALPPDPGLRGDPLHPPPGAHLRLHALVAGEARGAAGRRAHQAAAQGPPAAAPGAPAAARHDRQGAAPTAATAGAARRPREEGPGVLHPGQNALHKGRALMSK